MPAGRPTLYSSEILQKAAEYLDNYQEQGDVIPSIAGLAIVLNLNRSTIHAWVKDDDKDEFSNIVDKLLHSQEQKLVNKGLEGEFNASITKLLLTKHGYSDSQNIRGSMGISELTHEEWLDGLD